MGYDFGGYATKNNIRCSDGRTIMPDAFKECDGQIVPLVWQHVHDSTDNVLGHAELENRPDGVYAYCSLNSTDAGKNAAELVKHGDICALSIYANRLRQSGNNVMHGVIREVSLVLAGANPGATIDNLAFAHADGSTEIIDDEAYISWVDTTPILFHADSDDEEKEEPENEKKSKGEESDKTIEEIIETMNEEQKAALYAIVGALSEEQEEKDEKAKKPAKKPEPEDEDAEIEHADKSDDGSGSDEIDLEEFLANLDDDQQDAIDKIMTAIDKDDDIPEEAIDIFEKMSEDQKKAVYALVAAVFDDEDDENADDGKSMAHADDPTIQDILGTLDDTQKAAVDRILNAVDSGAESVPKEIAGVFDTLSDEQKDAVYALVGLYLEDQEGSENKEDAAEHSDFEGEMMKYNVFDAETNDTTILSHSDMEAVFADAPRIGSLKEAALAHGIQDIEVLFPEAQAVNAQPYQIARRMEWVSVVLNGVKKSPFSRIKSTAANLTEEQARAKGYIKGRKKIEEQITALRRVTTPQTIYKLQKLDRDDVVDITDFDVVAWMKQEMRMMLDEELARAILVGDGRLTSDPDKIFQNNIRSIWQDDEMYTIHKVISAANATDYTAMIDEIVRSRKGYKGSGTPVMFIGPDALTEMRLLKDNDNRMRYDSDAKLAEAMRVSAIHEVELFDDLTRDVEGKQRKLVAIIVNLMDYTVGANKGGEVNLFDDFDLDYNKLEYLIETRCCGALVMPKSAIAIEIQTTTDSPANPTYTKVTSPSTDDIEDYFEQDEYGRYFATTDSAVVAGKTYFVQD